MSDTYVTPNLAPEAPLDLSPEGAGTTLSGSSGMQSPGLSAPEGPQQSFGSSLRNILPGPHYQAPDPATSALDQSASLLEQRVKRAGSIATNPLAQIFAPEQAAAAREFMPKAAEQLQKIEQQKSAIASGRVQAHTLGLSPGEVSDQATQEDRLTIASAKALKGDMRAFQGIQAVAPERAAAIAPQVYETVAGHLTKAQLAFDSLSAMESEGQYRAKVNQLRQDGTLRDLESLGMKLPSTFDAFQNVKAAEGRALREARIGINTIGQKLEERNTYQPMEKKEAETYDGLLTTPYGDKVANGVWGRNGASGTRGKVLNGMATVDSLGRGGVLGDKDQRKEIGEEFRNAVPKESLEKIRSLDRIGTLATKKRDGKFIPPEGVMDGKERIFLNTNPNIQQGLAEGFAAALRSGAGGATGGLLNIETSKRGAVQALLDKIKAGYAGGLDVISGEQVRPYLTQLTQKQQREVLDGLREYNSQELEGRATEIAKRAGALGFDSSALGLSKNETNGTIDAAIEEGRLAQIERMRPGFQPIGGGNGVLQLAAQRPGAAPAALPGGAQPANQLPGAQSLLTPVQQAGQPSPVTPQPQAPQPPSGGVQQPGPPSIAPGGPGQPVTVAGQQVSVPGVPASYVTATQRIESGNERDPWTAGTKNSSASGAFQFIDSTWRENKPAGAPSRAKDATPAQQAEAFATLTARNAATLKAGNLPVSNTSLYIAHNLGAGGGAALMSADPSADARSIVGEAAARNNPMFFKGRPTVATVLQRYQDAMAGAHGGPNIPDDEGPKPKPGAGGATASFNERLRTYRETLRTSGPGADLSGERNTPEQLRDKWADVAPAVGSTVGAVGGALSPVPGGAVMGGAAGGAAGQVAKSWLKGENQNPQEIAKQAALGGVLGIMPAGRPIAGAAARVAGVSAIEAADAASKGETVDAVEAGLKGGAYALGGEALGRFVSSAGAAAHKTLSRYTPSAQQELAVQAGKLAEARKTLNAEQPKLPGEGGPNPKYDAAKKQADEAAASIKEHSQNPDDMVHAYEQAKAGVSAGEAATLRKAESERRATSQGYNELREGMRDTGVGAPKANQPLPDGPVAQIRTANNPTGKVETKFAPDAEHAEMLVKAPAKDWGEKWQQLQNAGTELIEKRRAFLVNGDKPSADAMDAIFQGVRNRQKAAANYVYGPKEGPKVIERLEKLDQRYAKIMNATQGMDYGKMRSVIAQGNTPERRELEKNFKEFAGDDPSAMRAFNAMKAGAKGRMTEEAKLMVPIITAESLAHVGGLPSLGMISVLVGGHRLYKVMQEYANAKVLGKAVVFKDFLNREIQSSGRARQAVGATGSRAAVQSGDLPGDAGSALAGAMQ